MAEMPSTMVSQNFSLSNILAVILELCYLTWIWIDYPLLGPRCSVVIWFGPFHTLWRGLWQMSRSSLKSGYLYLAIWQNSTDTILKKHYTQVESYLMCLYSEQAYQQYQKYNFWAVLPFWVIPLFSEQHSAFRILMTFNIIPLNPMQKPDNINPKTTILSPVYFKN